MSFLFLLLSAREEHPFWSESKQCFGLKLETDGEADARFLPIAEAETDEFCLNKCEEKLFNLLNSESLL